MNCSNLLTKEDDPILISTLEKFAYEWSFNSKYYKLWSYISTCFYIIQSFPLHHLEEQDYFISIFNYTSRKLCVIPHSLDQLIGKWLKIKKYFINDKTWRISNFALFHQGDASVDCSEEYPPTTTDGYPPHPPNVYLDRQVSPERLSTRYYCLLCNPLPWMWVINHDEVDIDVQKTNFICNRDFEIFPTSNPKIYVISFSKYLKCEKDIAKIVRHLLLHPESFPTSWTFYVEITLLRNTFSIYTLGLGRTRDVDLSRPSKDLALLDFVYEDCYSNLR